jgi:predicted site-specific integrase-resolvase
MTKHDIHKKAMIEALEKSLGIVTTACKQVGISRETHYRWTQEDPDYKAAVDSLQDMVLDFAESQLHKQIQNGEVTSTIFYLKTKGKRRGYIERQEMENSGQQTIKVVYERIDSEAKASPPSTAADTTGA